MSENAAQVGVQSNDVIFWEFINAVFSYLCSLYVSCKFWAIKKKVFNTYIIAD